MQTDEFITKNAEETEKQGEEFAKKLSPGDVLCLYGNLGAGKTTFVRGLAGGLGIKTRIMSPTFVIVREHEVSDSDIKKLYHLDLYRLQSEKDVLGIDLKEILSDKTAVTVIEWPELGQNTISKKHFDIRFEEVDSTRKITIVSP